MRATFSDATLQQALERDGYATLPFIDDVGVDRLIASYDQLGLAPGDPQRACISTFHTFDIEYKRATNQAIMDVIGEPLSATFDRQRPLPCNYIVKWPGGMSGFGLHQDLSLVDEREHRSVEVWIALTDIGEDNGQLWMVPGSHAWMPTIRGIHAFPFAFGEVGRRIIEHHAVPVPLRRGDAIVFSHATLHFSLPNRTDQRRMVAITDMIPEEAQHLHYFGDGEGHVDAYEIDDSFWVDNSPFTLWRPPPASRRLGPVDFDYRPLTDADLDRLVAEGRAVEGTERPRGAINPGRRWCHRCGASDLGGDPLDRWVGNITLLCESCQDEEIERAATPAHAGA